MGNKNYTKYSVKSNNDIVEEPIVENITEEVVENVIEPVVENMIEEVVENITEEVVENVIEPVVEENEILTPVSVVAGVVTDCSKLNVRKEPNKDAEVVCVLNKDEIVNIENAEETHNGFFKVFTPSGIEGYCMVNFINIK